MNNKFEIVVYWSEQESLFLAEVPEIPSIITDGPTRRTRPRIANSRLQPEDYFTGNPAGMRSVFCRSPLTHESWLTFAKHARETFSQLSFA